MNYPEQFQSAMNNFNQSKPEGDIDLVKAVRDMLIEAGLGQKVSSAYDNNHYIQEAIGKPSNIQRFIINRYWNHQLLLSSANSMEQRYCLIPNGEISDWLKLFRESILPFVIQNDLPR